MSEEVDYIKVKIVGLFNLEEIANEYKTDKNELREFHNLHCSLQQIIPKTFVNYLEHIYLPISVYNEWKDKQLPNTYLSLPQINSTSEYGVLIEYFPQNMTIHHTTKVIRNHQSIEITKEKSYINDEETELMLEQILEKTEQVIYPLKLNLDTNGMFDKIINEEEIKNRWENVVYPLLKEYYKAETSEKIFHTLNDNFINLNFNKITLRKKNYFINYFLLQFIKITQIIRRKTNALFIFLYLKIS